MNSGPDPLRPSGRAPPSAPEPRSPTAAPVATGFSQTGRSPSEEKFPQWPRAAGKYSLSPLVGQSESAAERNTSPHSEVGDPPPEPDFIPFIWDEIPFSQKKEKKEEKKKKKKKVFNSVLTLVQKQERKRRSSESGVDGEGGAGRPLSAGSSGPRGGGVGKPGRAGAGCRCRRPPFANPEMQKREENCRERGAKPKSPQAGTNAPDPRRQRPPEPTRRESPTQLARLVRSPGRGRGRRGAEMLSGNE